ncbi:hypothetical protein ID866_12038 [Astraeus odoratus]|nr:hypothetical protein ID866_12038 [Astraeus odoratus]
MSAFCHTPSLNDTTAVKVKDPWQCMEEDWMPVSEAKLDPVSSDDEGTVQLWKQDEGWREAEERRVHEEVAQEEAEKKEREEREAAAWKAWEAVEVWVDAEWRALKERLWDAAVQHSETVVAPPQVAKPGRRMSVAGPSTSGQRVSGVQDPCTWGCNKGTLCVLGMAKGKTMACKACHHVKVNCSWMKMTGEVWKKKWVHCLEETDNVEMVEVSKDDKEEDAQSHFAVPPHLMEEHQDALGC